jgi:lycopene cyclase domain-containing protein
VTVSRFGYVAMLVFTVIGSGWLEFAFHTQVYRRWRRWMLSIAPIFLLFVMWDRYAIAERHWWFDGNQTLGWTGPFAIPVEEYAFFVVVPIAAILTLEAVRRVQKQWRFGDES